MQASSITHPLMVLSGVSKTRGVEIQEIALVGSIN